MNKAIKSDWKTLDMPEKTASFSIDIGLTEGEFSTLQNGHIPCEMEDKWFEYFENNILYIHRSWTGICIYKVRFSTDRRIEEVVVNRDNEQYRETSIERDKVQVMMRINSLCGRTGNGELMLKYIKSGR